MEEAIVDVALDLNLLPAEHIPQQEAQQDRRTDHRDQAQLLASVPQVDQVSSPLWSEEPSSDDFPERPQGLVSSWSRNRSARVEALRQCVANGTYQIDSAELALCILRNSTRFVETC
ncbi:MAG TPA: flagellar biosynthesis anti-sigma factor FlgM [Ktedonobacteraceae bacterium]